MLPIKRIIMVSAGLDSTYMAWRMIRDGVTGLHLHHISIRNNINKLWIEQDERMPYILEYFRDINPDFEYSETVFEFYGWSIVGYDSDLQALVGQKIAENLAVKHKVELYIGLHAGSLNDCHVIERISRNVNTNIWKSLVQSVCYYRENIDEEIHYPLVEDNKDKSDMIKEMPKELLDLTWSCRHPNNGKPCTYCKTCREIKEAYQKIG